MQKNNLPKTGYFMFYISTLFFCYEFILRVSPGIMAADLMRTYGLSASMLGFMGSIFFQAYAWMQIPVGILFDRYSPRKILGLACFICALGTTVFSLASSYYLLILGRLLIGAGAAFGFIGALKVAEQWLPLQQFARMTGMLATMGFIGAMLSDNILNASFEYFGWQHSLLTLGIIGFGMSGLIYYCMQDSAHFNPFQKKIDFKEYFRQILNICRNPFILLNGLIGFCLYFPTSAFAELWGKNYLQDVLHMTSKEATFAVSMIFLGWAIGSPLQGWLYDKTHNEKWLFAAGALLAATCIMIVLYASGLTTTTIYILLFLFGVFSSCEIINFAYAKRISSPDVSAAAMAITNVFVMLGGVFSQPIIGWFLDKNWGGLIKNSLPASAALNYHQAFLILPGVLLLAALLALFLKNETTLTLEKSTC